MITENQWDLILNKYEKLMYKICHMITGDTATASFDDNLQDIQLAALEAVLGFTKQDGGKNGSFDDFWGTKGFDQYIKTCLWTKKNNKGAKITKKSNLYKGTVSTDKEEVLNIEDTNTNSNTLIFLEEITHKLNDTQKEIINTVISNPDIIKPNGKINIKQLAEEINSTWFETDKQIKQLSLTLKNEF